MKAKDKNLNFSKVDSELKRELSVDFHIKYPDLYSRILNLIISKKV